MIIFPFLKKGKKKDEEWKVGGVVGNLFLKYYISNAIQVLRPSLQISPGASFMTVQWVYSLGSYGKGIDVGKNITCVAEYCSHSKHSRLSLINLLVLLWMIWGRHNVGVQDKLQQKIGS
jgi:hypothetical protein